MSNNYEWYEDDDDLFEDLLDEDDDDNVLKKVRKAERAKDKRIRELEAQLSELNNFKRTNSLTSILSEKGVNPKIAKFIPADMEITDESVLSWLNENGELFGVAVKPSQNQESNDYSALRQIDAVTNTALSPDGINDMFSAVNNAQSEEELLNLIFGSE